MTLYKVRFRTSRGSTLTQSYPSMTARALAVIGYAGWGLEVEAEWTVEGDAEPPRDAEGQSTTEQEG